MVILARNSRNIGSIIVMSNPLLVVTILIYGYVSFEYLLKKEFGMALAFFAYAVANIGFILHNILSNKSL